MLKNYIKCLVEELFDLDVDLDELVNLVGRKEFEEILVEMRMEVERW